MNPSGVSFIVVAVFVSLMDGIRDANVGRQAGWWRWHIVKWFAFYTPFIALIYCCEIRLGVVFAAAVVASAAWRLGYQIKLGGERS